MIAVIQAGGQGTRLRPYTLILPKPLVPVGAYPVIEILLRWLRRNGITDGIITLGYLGQLIRAVCRDGAQWDLSLKYIEENNPLGTLGALHLIGKNTLNSTFISLNGDIITDMNLRQFINFHKSHKGILTVATATKRQKIDLGVMEIVNDRIIDFKEKPTVTHSVSMGIYCMEPEILNYIPKNVAFGFDDLMFSLLDRKIPVYSYHHPGIWMDIGRPEDYAHAQKIFEEKQDSILGVC